MQQNKSLRQLSNHGFITIALLILLGSAVGVIALTYNLQIMESNSPCNSAPIILQNGTAGTSIIYTNSTSAKVSVGSTGAWSDELLVNPGFEMGNLTGWTVEGPAAASVEVFNSTSGGDSFTNRSLRIGNYGVCTKDAPGTNDDSGVWQNVSLTAYVAAIDADNAAINASAWLYPSEWDWDDVALIVRFYNSSGGFISAWNTTGEYGNDTTYHPKAWMLGMGYSHFTQGQLEQFGCYNYPIPVGTRTVGVQVGMGEHKDSQHCGGQADEASVKIRIGGAQKLYAHQELIVIGGLNYSFLKLNSADSAGETHTAGTGTSGRKIMGQWIYQLTGVSSIPASTWAFYYNVNKTNSAVEAHCDVNIQIRMSNGTVRQTIASDVANSGAIALSYSTLSGTYSWANYAVVNETDYLEVDYYVEVTSKRNNEYVNLRVDDSTLAEVNQTRITNVYLPNACTYDYVLRVNNTDTDSWKIRLKKCSDSSIGRLQNCTIYFHNVTDGTSSQLVIENGLFINETGPWYDLEDSETIYIAMTTQANSTGTSLVQAYLEIRVPNTTTYAQYIITYEIT